MEIRNITGDYLNTQARWDARKEKRRLQSLIINSEEQKKKKENIMEDKRFKTYNGDIIHKACVHLRINLRRIKREKTGDYLNTQERWNARKERRKLQSLISDSQSGSKKKRL